MNREEVSKRMKEIRSSQGYNVRELAAKMGISAGYLSQLENGSRNTSIDVLFTFCEAANMDIKDFFEISNLNIEEQQLLSLFRKLSDEDKKYIKYLLNRLK